MNTELLTLEQRITRLEDIEQIKQLKARYAHYLDNGFDAEGIASLFAEDGQWIIEGETIKGRKAIIKHCEKLPRIISWSLHTMTTSTIEVKADGKHADCIFYVQSTQTMNLQAEDSKAYIILGMFKDKCIKIDGKWYFAEVKAQIQQSALWAEGWVESPFFTGFFKTD